MTPGVSYASVSTLAVMTATVGTWDTNYPVTNLRDMVNIAKVARVTPTANAASFNFVLPSAQPIQMIGLVRHTIPAGASVRIRLYSDNNPTAGNTGHLVADTTVTSVWGANVPVAGYAATRPFVLSAAVSAQSGLIELTSLTGVTEIGGVELAQWWAWPGINVGREFGWDSRAERIALAGGGAQVPDIWMARTITGQIDLLALGIAATVALDFQKNTGRQRPFVWVPDYDDSTTWPRGCFLARNTDLPPMIGALYRHDTFQVRFREHWR